MLTDNDIKEELNYAYIHAVSSFAGFSCERTTKDRDSVDTRVCAKGKLSPASLIESPSLEIQLKATCDLTIHSDTHFSFPLPIKNYNELRTKTQNPRFLVVLDLPTNSSDWLTLTEDNLVKKRCAYWVSLLGEPFVANTTSKTVYIPKANVFTPQALKQLLEKSSRLEHLL